MNAIPTPPTAARELAVQQRLADLAAAPFLERALLHRVAVFDPLLFGLQRIDGGSPLARVADGPVAANPFDEGAARLGVVVRRALVSAEQAVGAQDTAEPLPLRRLLGLQKIAAPLDGGGEGGLVLGGARGVTLNPASPSPP